MDWVQFKDLLCYLCLCGTVLSFLSLTQEIVGSNTAILLGFFWSLNSANSVKTFKENSIECFRCQRSSVGHLYVKNKLDITKDA